MSQRKGWFDWVDEDISRRTIAVSVKASKLTARGLAYALRVIGRKIAKHHRAKQTPHGKQSVKKLMAHGASASSIELSGDTKLFDRVARNGMWDYAFYKTGAGQISAVLQGWTGRRP